MKPFQHETLPGMQYYAHFVTAAQQQHLLHHINSHPAAWKRLNNRTLQNWGGLPHIKGMLQTPLPPFLLPLVTQLTDARVFATPPNHVLINRYLPGQGIHPHVDGPAYKPVAAIISLQAPILMHFYHTTQHGAVGQRAASMLLHPRSLLVLSQHVYHHMFHAIAETTVDHIDQLVLNATPDQIATTIPRQERTSLTVRTSCRTIPNMLGRKR
ncbi:Alpha-ketoglutarate-dependent dioxygenase alkB-like [Gracilariopsis chorda]|uniref:Alpha-ketoglutarate-dependent dioxygenase alkB-like n=1 Tax=Gracilariopsis chorda TaxID=448386 RepID=A0A2V3J5V4_9FLOR|nr:Alpha-ketoglutarate-dependent dioxygenase alkB-like [Gracilariopsis chorda]|eukprot:PXF49367.1 Alpha-ketoglutarate-dependent dioxygenase alkB-like [Gracilariopsis chorda]